jgi:uncharacterized protein involved in exopolysaccharide biosynthesis
VTKDPNVLDVGGWFMTLVRNWWVILACVVLGGLVGLVITMATPKEYTATATVYIGQTTDANGNPMAGLNSNARAATQLLASDEVLTDAAARVGEGLKPGALGRNTSVETPTAVTRTTTSAVNLVVISVTDGNRKRAAAAANALADVLLEHLTQSVDVKIQTLQKQLDQGQAAYDASVKRSNAAQDALNELAKARGGVDKAVAAPYLAIVEAASAVQQSLELANQKTELLLLTARQVEMPQLLHKAATPSEPSGPSMALNVAAGALAGFVVGIIAAFARVRLAQRRKA